MSTSVPPGRSWYAAAVATGLGLLLAVTVVAPAATVSRGGGADAQRSTAEQLRSIERARLRALVDARMPEVRRLHTRDFQLVNPPGFQLKRQDYLPAVRRGDIDYLVFEPVSRIRVRVSGRSAVLWYRSQIDIVAAGIGEFSHETWHMYLYEKRRGGWRVVREQATAVGGFPPAA